MTYALWAVEYYLTVGSSSALNFFPSRADAEGFVADKEREGYRAMFWCLTDGKKSGER